MHDISGIYDVCRILLNISLELFGVFKNEEYNGLNVLISVKIIHKLL